MEEIYIIIWMKDYRGIKNREDVYYVNSWKYLHLEPEDRIHTDYNYVKHLYEY